MAINYGGYAQSYAGNFAQDAANLSNKLGIALQTAMVRKKENEKNIVQQAYQDALGGDFMGGNMLQMMSKDPSEWGDVDSTGITNPFDSYNQWKATITPGSQSEKYARELGLLNPISWIQNRQAYSQAVAPSIGNKIIQHQSQGNKSDAQMREWIGKKGLGTFIKSNFSDTTNPAHNQLQMWATPEVTLGQQFQNLGRYFTEGWTPGGALAVGTAAATAPVWGPSAMKGAQWVGSKIPGMSTLASRYAKTGPVGAVGAGIAASQLAGQAGHAIGGEVGEQTAEAIASGGITAGLGALQKYVNTHGYSKLMKLVVKKKGKSFAMKTLGKLGLGLIGGGATGGIATAAMAAWTAKDLYEVVQLISSETSK